MKLIGAPCSLVAVLPFSAGTTWRCHTAVGGFDLRKPVLVVCTDDWTFYTTTP